MWRENRGGSNFSDGSELDWELLQGGCWPCSCRTGCSVNPTVRGAWWIPSRDLKVLFCKLIKTVSRDIICRQRDLYFSWIKFNTRGYHNATIVDNDTHQTKSLKSQQSIRGNQSPSDQVFLCFWVLPWLVGDSDRDGLTCHLASDPIGGSKNSGFSTAILFEMKSSWKEDGNYKCQHLAG